MSLKRNSLATLYRWENTDNCEWLRDIPPSGRDYRWRQ